MKPSNPATHFVSRSDQESFTFVPGKVACYAIGHAKSHVAFSLLLFADSPWHARQVLRAMADHALACAQKYARSGEDKHDPHGLGNRALARAVLTRDVLEGNRGYKLEIGTADPTQVYKVGWASNDTI